MRTDEVVHEVGHGEEGACTQRQESMDNFWAEKSKYLGAREVDVPVQSKKSTCIQETSLRFKKNCKK